MEKVWDNSSRFDSINVALGLVPHDQIALGLGFRLTHDPTKCRRCRATISLLELGGIINAMENNFESEKMASDS